MNPDTLFDPTFGEIEEALRQVDEDRLELRVQSELRGLLKKLGESPVNSVTLGPEQAYPILQKLHDEWLARMLAYAMRFSKLRWHWYARRLPDVLFSGSLPSTEHLGRALFETVANLGGNPIEAFEVDSRTGGMIFEISPRSMAAVEKMAVYVRVLHNIQVSLRWTGKGASMKFDPGQLPSRTVSGPLEEAVHLYDQRSGNEAVQFTRLGTVMSSAVGGNRSLIPLGGFWKVSPPRDQVVDYDQVTGAPTQMQVRYAFASVYFGGVISLLDDDELRIYGVWNDTVSALATLLHAGLLAYSTARRLAIQGRNVGYFLLSHNALKELVEFAVPEMNAALSQAGLKLRFSHPDRVIPALLAKPSAWPLKVGPLLLPTGEGYLIDLANSIQRLYQELEYPPVTDTIANIRSAHFEKTIQALIDDSSWKPAVQIRSLRGRTLRLNGEALTDLDAIGFNEGTLLIVSCKSIRYTADYDAGDWRVVRNVASRIEQGVQELDEILRKLAEERANIVPALPEFNELVGFVCTPHTFFVPPGRALEEASPGIRKACSASELKEWLDAATTGADSAS